MNVVVQIMDDVPTDVGLTDETVTAGLFFEIDYDIFT